MSDNMDRSVASRTDSDLASSSKLGDLVGSPGSPTGHSADGLVEFAAAIRLNLGSDLGVKNGGKWRVFRGPKAPFFRAWSRGF